MTSIRPNILHIFAQDKFIPPFIKYVNNNFDSRAHTFFFLSNRSNIPVPEEKNVISYNFSANKIKMFLHLKRLSERADRIFLHGLFKSDLIIFLFFAPSLRSKVFWIMWGGDVYFYQPKTSFKEWLINLMRVRVIRKIKHFVTAFKGDYDYLDQKFSLDGKVYYSYVYESNIFKPLKEKAVPLKEEIVVLVGNSASHANEHQDIFIKLKKLPQQNFKIICPLSYGNRKNKLQVMELGKKMFGDRFIALTDFLPIDEYNEIMSQVDIVMFNHKRQQAVGNIVTLLGLGKKVYLQPCASHTQYFRSLGLKVFDITTFCDLSVICEEDKKKNLEIVKGEFNYEVYKSQLCKLFNLENKEPV